MATKQITSTQQDANHLPRFSEERLPYHPAIQERFGIDRAAWRVLVEAVYPAAQSVDSILLALSYCRARGYDPLKRVVHIVPIWDSSKQRMVDTIWPGIAELRITAFRTGQYAGRDQTVFGQDVTRKLGKLEITFPEWAQVTVYRLVGGQRLAFVGPRVYWREAYAPVKKDDPTPNSMWSRRPRGQLDKCAEAAALRAAFPEAIGGELCAEEASGIVLGDQQRTPQANGSRADQVAAMLGEPAAPEAEPADEAGKSDDLKQRIADRIAAAATTDEVEALKRLIDDANGQQALPFGDIMELRKMLAAREGEVSGVSHAAEPTGELF